MRNKNKTLDLKTLVVCLFFTAITCLFGTLTVPNQPVLRPRPMGSVGACLAGGKLGPKKGGLTQLLYLLLVLIGYPIITNVEYGVEYGFALLFWPILVSVGFPFTANFKSGAAAFFSPTAGYLFGNVLMAAVTGYCYRLFNGYFYRSVNTEKKRILTLTTKYLNMLIAGVIGTIAYSSFGLIYFMMATGYSLQQAIKCCVIPYIWADFGTILLSANWVLKSDNQFKNWWGRWWWLWL